MNVGIRVRELREHKQLSQGDIERRTGLLRCYTSRVENGVTIPGIATLERYAQALEVPLYQLFTAGETVKPLTLAATNTEQAFWGESGKDRSELRRFARALLRVNQRDRKLLIQLAIFLANRAAP